jgi:hypothetical protein
MVAVAGGSGDAMARPQSQRGEVWYRDAEHVRIEFRGVDASGSVTGLLGTWIRNGDDVWYFFEDGGTENGAPLLRVMHGSIRSPLGGPFAKGVFTPPLDLKSALATYWSNCPDPVLRGESEVAGRPAYVLDICGSSVWIDKQIYLVLRTQFGNSAPAAPRACASDTAMCTSSWPVMVEVTEFETDITISDAVFEFHAPAGTVVSEQPDLEEQ